MADTPDLKSGARNGRVGSNPTLGNKMSSPLSLAGLRHPVGPDPVPECCTAQWVKIRLNIWEIPAV